MRMILPHQSCSSITSLTALVPVSFVSHCRISSSISSSVTFPPPVSVKSKSLRPPSIIAMSSQSAPNDTFNPSDHPHRRYNPLNSTWVLVSPHRAKRPWQGAVEDIQKNNLPAYDPGDYLGPGNTRVNGGVKNPDYKDTFVFDNDFMAMLPDTPLKGPNDDDESSSSASRKGALTLQMEPVRGRCRVVCFSPLLNVTVAQMDTAALRKVVDTWTEEYERLGALEYIDHVQIFENKGQMMGCSNPHPHGQIWSSGFIPQEVSVELENLHAYEEDKNGGGSGGGGGEGGGGLLQDYVALEMESQIRMVCENDSFVAMVPFWAVWPFEILVVAKTKVPSLLHFDDKMKDDLADIYRRVTCRYDNLFKTSFPYSMGIHQAPTDGKDHGYAHFHMHFYPPLLRSATVRKFMVGFELLCEAQRDLTPEQAAERLRACSEVHYLESTQ